jgi:uncharacterized RDD family membrane protein YckC/type II secretory pathway pseudopilin PulG
MEQVQIKYAGFWVRWIAGIIDGMILGVVNVLLGALIGVALANAPQTTAVQAISSVVGLLASWIYHIAMTNTYQATLGKRLVGIMVMSTKGPALTLGQIIVRETVGKLLSTLTLFVGYLMAGVTAQKQALHDKMAGTVVIYKDPNKKTTAWVIVAVVACVFLFIALIAGILAFIVFASLGNARERARDARRIADVRQIVLSLELYKEANKKYPATITAIELPGTYIKQVPVDPTTGDPYLYRVDDASDPQDYVLGARLERADAALDEDVDGTVYGQDCADTTYIYCVQPGG